MHHAHTVSLKENLVTTTQKLLVRHEQTKTVANVIIVLRAS